MSRPPATTPKQDAVAAGLAEAGWSARKISQHLGKDDKTITAAIARHTSRSKRFQQWLKEGEKEGFLKAMEALKGIG